MSTWKVILATLVIFGAGVITGGLLVGYSDRAARRPARRVQLHGADKADNTLSNRPRVPVELENASNVRENRMSPLRKEFLERLNRELTLSPDQREQIEQILSQGQERTRDLWRAQMVLTRQKIRAQLTPEQQARFQELLKQRPGDQRHPPTQEHSSTNSPEPAISSNSPATR